MNKNFSKIKSAVGCYNIEGPAKNFENIEGSFYNIIGLDIIKFLRSLKSIWNNIIGIVEKNWGLSPYIHNYWSKKYKQTQYQK